MEKIIVDRRITNALCRRLMRLIESKGEIYQHPTYGYIEFTNVDDINGSIFTRVEYKDAIYKLKFFDGCFSPYFVKL